MVGLCVARLVSNIARQGRCARRKRGIYHVPRKNAGNNIDATHTIRTTLRKEKAAIGSPKPTKNTEDAGRGGELSTQPCQLSPPSFYLNPMGRQAKAECLARRGTDKCEKWSTRRNIHRIPFRCNPPVRAPEIPSLSGFPSYGTIPSLSPNSRQGLPGLLIRYPSASPGTPVRVFPGMWMPLPTSRFRFPTPG